MNRSIRSLQRFLKFMPLGRDIIEFEQFDLDGAKVSARSVSEIPMRTGLKSEDTNSSPSILCFATSRNQIDVMLPSLEKIRSDIKVHLVVHGNNIAHECKITPSINFSKLRKAAGLKALPFLFRYPAWSLSFSLKNKAKGYKWLPGLLIDMLAMNSLIQAKKPDLVLISNDHLRAHRALMAVCRIYRIPTAYIQHASVSTSFPRLNFDYALLDGRAALEIYNECSSNHTPSSILDQTPTVLFSGVKRKLNNTKVSKRNAIGIAINPIDDVQKILTFSDRILDSGDSVVFRWHPRQEAEEVRAIVEWIKARPNTSAHNPKENDVGDFFSKVRAVIAGDSGILLEAALQGCASLYFPTGEKVKDDYYGFVSRGISHRLAPSAACLKEVMLRKPNIEALRAYSATYGTPWHGKEDELLARSLEAIILQDGLDRLYQAESSLGDFIAVHAPKIKKI